MCNRVVHYSRNAAIVLLATALMSPLATQAANAFGQKLDKYLPAKLAGWLTDPPFDDQNAFDHSLSVTQTFSSKDQESNLTVGIERIQKNSRIGLPKLEQAKLGRHLEGSGVTSMQTVKGHKALLDYDSETKGGKLTIVAGSCVVMVEGGGVSQPQLIAAANAVDVAGLDNACQ